MSVQSIARGAALLRLVATSGDKGARLTDLCAATGLTKPTAHRILSALVDENLIELEPRSRRYHIGLGTVVLGASASGRYDVRSLARPSLERIAERTGDTAYLWARQEGDAVCLDRAEGSFPVRVLTWNVGYRRPLGVGAGSLALLAELKDADVQHLIAANRERRAEFALVDDDMVWHLVSETRELGFAFARGLVIQGMSAIGIAVPNRGGPPQLALSAAAITERLGEERRAEVADILRVEATELSARLSPETYAPTAGASKPGGRTRQSPAPVGTPP